MIIYISEYKDINNIIYIDSFNLYYYITENYNQDKTIRILFSYKIENRETNLCSIKFMPYFNINYFHIVADFAKPYELSIGTTKNFSNILEYYRNYFFITGIEKFQRINITIIAQSISDNPFYKSFIRIYEYINRTEEYKKYIYYYDPENYNYKIISKVDKIYSINFFYNIDFYTIIALSLKFPYDLNYLSLKVEAHGGEISFYDNYRSKNITNLKGNYTYYFHTKTSLYQITLITLFMKYTEKIPFDKYKIFLYRKGKLWFREEREIEKSYISDKNELVISFSYQMNYSSDISEIRFQFIPKYDLDYVFAKMDIMGGSYYLNDEDIQKFYNIYPGYEILFWIESSQNDTIIINLKNNYLEGNFLNDIDIYEYNYPLDNDKYYGCIKKYYKYIKQPIIPVNINNLELISNFTYIIENSGTHYVLLKINPKKFLDYLEIKVNTHKKYYNIISCEPLKINNINPGNLFYFLINATIYNKLFINLTFSQKDISPLKYFTINEYENRNDLKFIKSINQTFDLIKKGNQSNIELTYIPMKSSCKYIDLILEANSSFDYLILQVDIGGGYYEFYKDCNISKIIAGTFYYFLIGLSRLQKIEMKITLENTNINKNPFTFANIYEKEKKDDISYNKYYNLNSKTEKIGEQLVVYFTYLIDYFSTNYILIELIPQINLKMIRITYELLNVYNILNNEESNNISKALKNMPYYFFINSKQYQQVNINLSINYLEQNPFEFLEIYEYSDNLHYNNYNKYTNKSIKFLKNYNNNKFLTNDFIYMIDSLSTNFILIKIKPIVELEYLNIKINVGGGYYDIDKGLVKNFINLYANYSYYIFALSSYEEKLRIKLIINTNEIKKPINTLNILEYQNKNSPSIYLQNSNKEYQFEINNNELIITFSYLTKEKDTNFIALEILPNYKLNSIQCLIEPEIEKSNSSSSFSLVEILSIILVIIIIFTLIIFIVYVKKICLKSSSDKIENLYQNKNDNDNRNEKKFELALLPDFNNSSIN